MTTSNIRTILGYNEISVVVFENTKGRVLANKIPGCKPHSYTLQYADGSIVEGLKRKKYATDAIA